MQSNQNDTIGTIPVDEMPKILSLDFALKKLQNTKFSLGEKTLRVLENPKDAFLKSLNSMDRLSYGAKKRLESYLSKSENEKYKDLNKFPQQAIADVLLKILNYMQIDKKSFPPLTRRECRIIITSNEIYDSKFVKIKNRFFTYMRSIIPTSSMIRALIMTYFQKYNSLKEDAEVKDYFQFAIEKYYATTKRIPHNIAIYKNDCDILQDNFCKDLAKKCLDIKKKNECSLSEIIENRYKLINSNMEVYNEIIKDIGLECLDSIKSKRDSDFYFDILKDIINSNLKRNELNKIVNKVLLDLSNNELANKQKELIQILLASKNYGDPRIEKLNWEDGIDPEAKRMFIQWLANEDLKFFFDIVFYDKIDTHGRKNFWQQYIKSRELQYSNVILSQEDYNNPKILEARREGRKFSTFKSSFDGTSCFILVFHNATIVEFSKAGNGLFLYDKDAISIKQNGQNYSNVSELKKTSGYEYKNNDYPPDLKEKKCIKIRHIDKWQNKTKNYLSNELGIYAAANYTKYEKEQEIKRKIEKTIPELQVPRYKNGKPKQPLLQHFSLDEQMYQFAKEYENKSAKEQAKVKLPNNYYTPKGIYYRFCAYNKVMKLYKNETKL